MFPKELTIEFEGKPYVRVYLSFVSLSEWHFKVMRTKLLSLA